VAARSIIDLALIDSLTGGSLGVFDVTCPLCSAARSTPANRREKIFRVWRVEENFASFFCVHCGESGYVRGGDKVTPPDPVKLAAARAEADERNRIHKAKRLSTARYLWSLRKPIAGTIADKYLRSARGYGGPLPATLGFLPARNGYPPALIAAFGIAREPEPGALVIDDDAVRGVHLTRLLPEGSDREHGEDAKIMIGSSKGWPIILAAPNDLLGLLFCEGIENGLSLHQASGLGVWVAGDAERLPALADKVPDYIDAITIAADPDGDGRKYADELADKLKARKFPDVQIKPIGTAVPRSAAT
jgi:hypothetical protein